jgi:hypothetical protein
MKPVSAKFPPQYARLMEQVRAQLVASESGDRVISQSHVLRYSLRVAARAKLDPIVAKIVLEDEEARGRSPTPPKQPRPGKK